MLRSHLVVDGLVVALIVVTLNADNLSIICLSTSLVVSLFLHDLFHAFFAYFVNA
ncbi:MAG: hypothetical protein V7K17_30530 [Nostoc sp.]